MHTKPLNDLVEKWNTEANALIDKRPQTTENLARADVYITCANALNSTIITILLTEADRLGATP